MKAGLEPDALVEVSAAGEGLVVRRAYTLAVLLAGVTEENLHGEVDTGSPVGNEAW